MLIRPATFSDAPAIAKIGHDVFTSTFAHTVSPTNLSTYLSTHYTPSAVLTELQDPSSLFRVSEQDGQIIGFVILRTTSSADEPCVADRSKPVELARIYVDASHHGQGVAKQLLDEAEELARHMGYGTIWLGVLPENTRAVRFYEKMGYVRVGEHEFWLGDQKDIDAIMVKSLR
jgi:ribosomal protein S18 acetylase RimI-like enzyme